MKNSWFVPVAALVVGVVGGYLTAKNTEVGSHSAVAESAQRSRLSNRPVDSGSGESIKKSRASSADEISRIPGSSARVQALLDFYSQLTPEQLAEEANKLGALPLGERMLASFLLFGRWAEVDPTAAMAFSNTMGMAGGFVRPTILQSWASVDPANAANYYTANPREFAMMDMMGGRGPMGGQAASSIIATEWARQDSAAALAWAASLGAGKTEAMNAVVGEVAKTDPRKAVDLLARMSLEERSGAYGAVASQYGALDFAEAQTWIRTLPADAQVGALAAAIGGFSNIDPLEAAKQIGKLEAGEARDRLVEDVVGDLARKNPQAAADFLKEQSSERAQRDSMRQLMPALTANHPIVALAFVNSYQPGPIRDSAAQAYVWSHHKGSPAEVIQVAETIMDDGDRDRAVGVAAMRWMREDAAAARAYVEASTSISDGAKERILEGRGIWGGWNGRGPRGGN